MERLDDSPECSSYFWCRPSELDSETSSIASPYTNTVFESEELSYFIQQHPSTSSSQRSSPRGVEQPFWDPSCHSSNDNNNNNNNTKSKSTPLDSLDSSSTTSDSSSSSSPTPTTTTTQSIRGKHNNERYKRRQTKMLLVSLIESFCRIYGDSPDANRKVFFLICQTLKSLGIIDTEFIDEMASVRTTFQRTFHKLFYAALHTVQTEPFLDQPHRLLLPANETTSSSSSSSINIDSISSSTPCEDSTIVSPSTRRSSSSTVKSQLDTTLALVSPSSWLDSPTTSSFSTNTNNTTTSGGRKALFDLSIHHSRYHDDFVELGLLGRGGFAMAYRVKNKLDGIDYAVKKVQLGRDLQQGKTPYKKIFREIKHLARLEHPNVIRYYASWLEYDAGQVQNDEDDEDENDDVTYETPQRKQTKELLYQQGSISQPVSPSTSTDKKKITVHGGWTLFIQMQLCQTTLHDYIEIRNRDYGVVDPERNIALFTQILHGTAYIHEQGLIHRDLKPSNIFLTLSASTYPSTSDSCISSRILWDECIPKIGDFGLAAALVDEDSTIHDTTSPPSSSPTTIVPPILTKLKTEESSSSSSSTSSSMMNLKEVVQSRRHRRPVPAPLRRAHTIGIGTRTYASPEQLCYSGRPYDEKVDIYSLGIIFFELYQPFTTWMERADAISNLKNAMLPDGFVEKYPKESALILWMMDHNPERRPSVKQLLNYELFTQTPTDMLATLTAKLQAKSEALDTKNKQVESLQVDMKRMELERQDMQRKLDELQQKLDSVSL